MRLPHRAPPRLPAAATPWPTEAETAIVEARPELAEGLRLAPWGPQESEDIREYLAFWEWLQTGAAVPKTALAVRNRWSERAAAYAASGALDVQGQARRDKHSLEVVQIAKTLAHMILAKHLMAERTQDHPGASLRDAMNQLKAAVMLERLLQGQSTDNVSVHVTEIPSLENLSDAEMSQISALLAKAAQKGQRDG